MSRRSWLLLSLLAVGCTDYELHPGEDTNDGVDTDEVDTNVDTDAEVPDEECNGEDDDGDGQIDEGYDDVDGDGVADCVDADCDLDLPGPKSEVDSTCEGTATIPPADPWAKIIEWQWSAGGAMYATPSIGDLDGDGTPSVVVTHGTTLTALDGLTGLPEWQVTGANVDGQSGTALADVDNDGYGDVVVTHGSCYSAHQVSAYDSAGARLWGPVTIGTACETYPAVADLEGDGDVEIVVNEYVLDGATGAVLFTLPISGTDNWGAPAVTDMDGDGVQEILLENRVYSATGALIMTCGRGGVGSFPHPVNADADDAGEVLVAGNGQLTLCDDDGTQLWARPYSSYGSAIAVADFDNDGVQEYAFVHQNALNLIEPDNTNRWSTTISDFSGLAGATSWDVDLDGVPEVVYADEQDILVMDGATGTVVIREPSHGSVTLAETPAVADVDGDGHGELVYVSNSGWLGVTVIGSADGDWPYSRPVYNQYGYYSENIRDDLSVPPLPLAPWRADANLFRGQPSALFTAGEPNLRAAITGVCAASCDQGAHAEIAVQVWNSGYTAVPAGIGIEVWADISGSLTLVAALSTSGPLAAGGSEEIRVETTAEALGSELTVVIDGDGAVAECNDDDNVGTWDDLPCP